MSKHIRDAHKALHEAYSAVSEALNEAQRSSSSDVPALMDAQNRLNDALSRVEPVHAKLPELEQEVEGPQATTEEKDDGTGNKPAKSHREPSGR